MTIFSAPAGGWISDRIGSRRLAYTIPLLIIAGIFPLAFQLTGWTLPAFMIFQGIITGAIPTAVFAAVPEVVPKPHLAGLGLGVLMTGQNLGLLLGPMVFGQVVEATTWTTAAILMIPVCLAGVVAGWLVKVR